MVRLFLHLLILGSLVPLITEGGKKYSADEAVRPGRVRIEKPKPDSLRQLDMGISSVVARQHEAVKLFRKKYAIIFNAISTMYSIKLILKTLDEIVAIEKDPYFVSYINKPPAGYRKVSKNSKEKTYIELQGRFFDRANQSLLHKSESTAEIVLHLMDTKKGGCTLNDEILVDNVIGLFRPDWVVGAALMERLRSSRSYCVELYKPFLHNLTQLLGRERYQMMIELHNFLQLSRPLRNITEQFEMLSVGISRYLASKSREIDFMDYFEYSGERGLSALRDIVEVEIFQPTYLYCQLLQNMTRLISESTADYDLRIKLFKSQVNLACSIHSFNQGRLIAKIDSVLPSIMVTPF